MIIDFDSWVDLYEGTISEVAISDEKRVLIFVSQTETDSACALLTLQGVLESDGIPYSTHTVQSYRDIQRVFSSEVPQGEKAPTLRTLFMINCGATADLADLLDLTADTRCIVMDSHRPIHHSYNNPEDMRCIVMLHPDEHLDTDAIPKPDQFADAFASTLDDDDDDENAGGSNGGENGETGANTRGRERQGGASGTGRGAPQTGLRERLGEDEDDADDDERASEEESPTEQGRHRQRQRLDGEGRYQGGPEPAGGGREDSAGPSSGFEGAAQEQERGTQLAGSRSQRQRWLQTWHEQKEEYYRRGRWYGAPAAYLAFALSHELRKDEPKYLWHAMVGTTDLRLQQHITDTEYNSYSAVLQAHQQCLDDDQLEEGAAAAAAGSESQLQDGTIAVKAAHLRISCRSDSHMVLLRQWSLYDALCFSPYVASQLNTYTDSGRGAIDMLLAKVGVPLVQAKSAYSSMKPVHRELMEENLPEWAEEFNLKQLYFRGFALHGGNMTQLSASDVVHAATALMCLPPSDDAAAQQSAFLQATQAVSSDGNRNVFKKGVEGCKVLHKSVVQDGGSLLSPGSQHVRRLIEKRLNTIRALQVVNTALFSHPVPLYRLALFLQAGLQQRSGVPEDVLLVGPSNKDGRSLVVGVAHNGKRGGSLRKGNRFSAAFREAAAQVQVHVSQDLFDAAYAQVHSDDLDNFLDMVGLLL